MIKLRSILVFAIIPVFAGYAYASFQGQKPHMHISSDFTSNAIVSTDRITLTNQGNIFSITHTQESKITTNNKQLIEAQSFGTVYVAINKQTNYSSLEEFTSSGKRIKTLLDGDTGNIDTMNWVTDPSVNSSQQEIAFVSDMDKKKTNILDNTLFVENVQTGSITKIAAPDPHSGGITHPVWNPSDASLITYDYYQYDKNYNPYSVIKEYNRQTDTTIDLTTVKQNAYQGSFSSKGKQFLFLGRNDDNTVTMYSADVTDTGLSNIHSLATGDFAYPQFSYTLNHIYFLQAQENNGYDLYAATIKNGKLSEIMSITSNAQLAANSGFSLTHNTNQEHSQ